MRKVIPILIGLGLVAVMVYEVTFRRITAKDGLVDMQAGTPRVVYGHDAPQFPWRRMIFGFRTRLPFGKVRLAPAHLYVDGGRIYCRLPDGKWEDLERPTLQQSTYP